MQDLSYPIGKAVFVENLTPSDRQALIAEFELAPAQLRGAVEGLTAAQLDTPYRPGGWTIRQVVHHLPDSHSNGYVRTKLTLTEDSPVIKPYDENAWAHLEDSTFPLDLPLIHFDAVQARWAALWKTMQGAQWQFTYVHPQYNTHYSLDFCLQLYAWHGKHHVAHVTSLKRRLSW